MTKLLRWAVPLLGWLVLLAAAAPGSAQVKEKIFRSLTPAQVEGILNDMNIKFKKTQPADGPKTYNFQFERNTYEIHLSLNDGKRLWIMAFFPRAPLETINKWNINAKFSRAVLDRVNDKELAIVEYQIDVNGGATESMVKQFIARFDNEVARFDQFLRNN
jgi:Putative bacterial sensory transduction regulator